MQFADGALFDLAFFNHLSTRDGSVVHLGDNTTGKGEGDDELLTVDLSKVYNKVDSIVFLVSSYQGHSLEFIRNAYCRLVDDAGTELARFTLTLGVRETGPRDGQADPRRCGLEAAGDRGRGRAQDPDRRHRRAAALRLTSAQRRSRSRALGSGGAGIGARWSPTTTPYRPGRTSWLSVDAVDLRLPLLAEGDDLLVGAAHEVPPHDDGLAERRAAEQQGPHVLVGREVRVSRPGAA